MIGDYVQNSVETQDPVELVCLLYAKAIEKLKAAREHLARHEIAPRAQAIAHVSQILVELQTSLDAERGGSIAVELARLYDYIQERLVEANAQQQDAPLEESLRLLETVYAGWLECRTNLALTAQPLPSAPLRQPTPRVEPRREERRTADAPAFEEEPELAAAAPRAWTL
ncbi:MAG: flagellar export chaperone FliS [Acidobacteria bacterium]|nr:flagellar export chaperone FliS [Acidobacteriota bacterium]